ncbi:hypothetical protein ACWD26_38155 [Streptomyces sp. NPDC002787]
MGEAGVERWAVSILQELRVVRVLRLLDDAGDESGWTPQGRLRGDPECQALIDWLIGQGLVKRKTFHPEHLKLTREGTRRTARDVWQDATSEVRSAVVRLDILCWLFRDGSHAEHPDLAVKQYMRCRLVEDLDLGSAGREMRQLVKSDLADEQSRGPGDTRYALSARGESHLRTLMGWDVLASGSH